MTTPLANNDKVTSVITTDSLPNLYFIILDGYANQHILKEQYNYDNSEFMGFLKNKRFFIADSSIANYYSTPPSLAATLNMEYLPVLSGAQIRALVLNNKILSVLKNNGYTLYNLQSGYSVTNGFSQIDSTIVINGPNEFERGILKFTIFRLDDLLGMIQHLRLKSQFEKLTDVANIKNNKKFTFVHIVAPHPPFVFNSKGEHVYNDKHSDNSWEPKKNYIEQLKYVNKKVEPFISQIIKNDPSGIIILQSDHGPWIQSKNEKEVFEARSMILNAVRYPGINNSTFKKSASSVNTFRFFIKQYIDSTFKLLKDSAAGKEYILQNRLFIDRVK
ncbi:MAG: sulfatase-like hydrolase/transferase [Bacteroidetes bacterium]|nr:sulfatase-like hydrolase/transferase [Bacteroidota bacterium]